MQAKKESVDRESYNSGRSVRNVEAEGRFEGIRTEPLASPRPARFRAPAEPFDERLGPLGLGRQRRERVGRVVARDAVTRQVVTDPLVAVTAVRQRSRPSAGEPLVIDIPNALERVEGVAAFRLVDPRAFEPLLDVAARAVAVLQRPGGDLDGIALGHARAR